MPTRPQLAIVIHTEEEFDWDGGFYRSNNKVTHGDKLISFCEKLIEQANAKVTFALDYAFVNSENGQKVIEHFRSNHPESVEFATHLHPWVNPPFNDSTSDKISNFESYPGNLSADSELAKLTALTNKITSICGQKPTTYLAGRYGVGKHTLANLKTLNYSCDISISPFCDFSHQEGPDFSQFNNDCFVKEGVLHWPHTTAILSIVPSIARWFNENPKQFETLQRNVLTKFLMKLLRVKRQRLSPEGFSLNDLKKITQTQLSLGQSNFILSFHSPSVMSGLTPYVRNKAEEDAFLKTTLDFSKWFKNKYQMNFVRINERK